MSALRKPGPAVRGFCLGVALAIAAAAPPAAADAIDDAQAGVAAVSRGELDVGLELLSRAVRSNELAGHELASVLITRGVAHLAKSDVDQALADFDVAIQLAPGFAEAYHNRAQVRLARGEAVAAIGDLDEAIRYAPGQALLYNDRGLAHFSHGDFDRALADFEQAILIDPDDPSAYANRGFVYGKAGEYDRALLDFDEVVRLDPEGPGGYVNRGVAFMALGAFDLAVVDFDAALSYDGGLVSAYFQRGYANFYVGDYAKAARDFGDAIGLRPNQRVLGLWHHLASARADVAPVIELATVYQGVDLTEWPGPVAALYLGQATPQQVLGLTVDIDPRGQQEKRCEAYFYIGQFMLLNGETEAAAQMFQSAVDTGITSFVEYTASKVELERLSR